MDVLNYFVFVSRYFLYLNTIKIRKKFYTHFKMTDILNSERDKNKGRPLSSVWDEIIRGDHVGSGKYQATCNYCNTTWSRGDVSKLEEHLANHCSETPA